MKIAYNIVHKLFSAHFHKVFLDSL